MENPGNNIDGTLPLESLKKPETFNILDIVSTIDIMSESKPVIAAATIEISTSISEAFNKEGILINEDLLSLIKLTGIELSDKTNLPELCKIIMSSESGWLRLGKRCESHPAKFDTNKDKIFRLANKLGFIEPLNASKLDSSIIYDIAAVHGSTPELRFSALIKVWQDGVRFKEIVVMTTSAVKIENEEARASGYPDTEMGFMQYIFTKLMLEEKVPVELKEMSVKWLDTEAPERKDRPQTHHTVIKLINEEEKIYDAGHILAVSTQPFAQYQNKIMEIVLTKAKLTNIKIASLAEEMPAETNLSILMDSIGRSIIVEAAYRALLAGDDRLLKMFM